MTTRKRRSGVANRGRGSGAQEETRAELKIDLAALAPPDQSFEADRISVADHSGTVVFHCQQRLARSPGSSIEVRMAEEAFLILLRTLQATEFEARLQKWITEHADLRNHVIWTPDGEAPVPAMVLRAQVAGVSHVGSDAEIAFYALPIGQLAGMIRGVRPTSQKDVVGVVRVTCHTLVLAEAVGQCKKLGATIQSAAGETA
jgi:hypothetical protein